MGLIFYYKDFITVLLKSLFSVGDNSNKQKTVTVNMYFVLNKLPKYTHQTSHRDRNGTQIDSRIHSSPSLILKVLKSLYVSSISSEAWRQRKNCFFSVGNFSLIFGLFWIYLHICMCFCRCEFYILHLDFTVSFSSENLPMFKITDNFIQ